LRSPLGFEPFVSFDGTEKACREWTPSISSIPAEVESTNNKIANAANKQKTERAKRLLGEVLASGGKLIGAQAGKNDDQCEQDAEAWARNAHT